MMNPKLYKAAKEGDMSIFDGLRQIFRTDEEANQHGIVVRTLHGNNNILHIAARARRDEFVAKALGYFPFLAEQVNSQGDTPLLVAARFGHVEVVEKLTRSATENGTNSGNSRLPRGAVEELVHHQSEQVTGQVCMAPAAENETNPSRSHPQSAAEEDRIDLSLEEGNIPAGMVAVMETNQTNSSSSCQRDVGEGQVDHQSDAPIPSHWRVTNLEGATVTTALHEALRNKHQNMARHILRSNPEMAAFDNLAGESPLFLAAESGCELFMSDILLSDERYSTNGPKGQNALHAARYCCGAIILELIKQNPDLMRKLDDQGKAAVHYAVEGEYWDFLDRMLEDNPSIALFPDSDGFTPFLRAASRGSWMACKKILKICPESIEACNDKGQNILHLSKFRNFFHGLRFLQIPEIWELRNVGDHEGNTPLHLAIKQNHHKVKAMVLTLSASVDLGAVNNEGLTALDLCESDTKLNKKRIMSNFLRRHLAPRGRRPNDHERKYFGTDWKALDADFKPFINTMILVATLIATITFAAAFTMPGGFDASGDKLGAATLAKTVALKIFIWADSIAMCCSITVVFLLSGAMLADQDVLPSVAENSFMLLYLTFFATLVAFMSGIFAVIAPKALWVVISVCIFCAAAFGLIAPARLPGFPLITLLRPVICRRYLQGRRQKTKQRNERKSEQNNVRSLIKRTPDN